MGRHFQKPETRWVVVCDRYSESVGDFVRDEFPILYGNESDATKMMGQLNDGSDLSYFDPSSTDGHLFVERISVYLDSRAASGHPGGNTNV